MRSVRSRARWIRATAGLALGWALAGCATQADLNEQGRKLQAMIAEQSRSIEGLTKDVERLRSDLAEGKKKPSAASRPAGPRATDKERVNALEKRLREAQPRAGSGQLGMTPAPDGTSSEETDQGAPPPPDAGPAATTRPADAPRQGDARPAPAAAGIDH